MGEKAVTFGEDKIGVTEDNIFLMVHRAYEKHRKRVSLLRESRDFERYKHNEQKNSTHISSFCLKRFFCRKESALDSLVSFDKMFLNWSAVISAVLACLLLNTPTLFATDEEDQFCQAE